MTVAKICVKFRESKSVSVQKGKGRKAYLWEQVGSAVVQTCST